MEQFKKFKFDDAVMLNAIVQLDLVFRKKYQTFFPVFLSTRLRHDIRAYH